MRGEFLGVWEFTWQEIWLPLSDPSYGVREEYLNENIERYDDLFCELYREINDFLINNYDTTTELADIIDDPSEAFRIFKSLTSDDFKSESSLRTFFESAYSVFDEVYESDNLKNKYLDLLKTFIEKYSLRYEVKAPCILVPSLPGLFSSLIREFKTTTQDTHLLELSNSFEEALKDFHLDQSINKIKNCLRVQFNLLEGVGKQNSDNNQSETFGRITENLVPHKGLLDAVKGVYKFVNDYPGIRHAGTPDSKIRELELRDLLVVTLQLSSYLPYLTEDINPENIYGGSLNL